MSVYANGRFFTMEEPLVPIEVENESVIVAL